MIASEAVELDQHNTITLWRCPYIPLSSFSELHRTLSSVYSIQFDLLELIRIAIAFDVGLFVGEIEVYIDFRTDLH
jgi:hypothetical protein